LQWQALVRAYEGMNGKAWQKIGLKTGLQIKDNIYIRL